MSPLQYRFPFELKSCGSFFIISLGSLNAPVILMKGLEKRAVCRHIRKHTEKLKRKVETKKRRLNFSTPDVRIGPSYSLHKFAFAIDW